MAGAEARPVCDHVDAVGAASSGPRTELWYAAPMPDAAFTIRFLMPVDGASIDRVRNFGEALMLRMSKEDLGDVSNPDTAISELSVSVSSPRHLGTARKLIRKTLAKHRLDADAVVTEIKGDRSETSRSESSRGA